ncbi:MAG: HipA N-terminal domain-containing protein [Pleomorphochaeta sp.]
MIKAKVFVEDKEAGVLIENDNGEYLFNYNDGYKGDIVSLTFSDKNKSYKSDILFPFFDGLIPEGWLLDKLVKNWKLDIKDRMSLLINCCSDCIGNVRIEKYE